MFPGEVDIEILSAINRYTYLTAVQLSRLRYPTLKDDGRYARRRLRALTEAGYLLRHSAFPTPQYGSAPFAFTLSRTGGRIFPRRALPFLGTSGPASRPPPPPTPCSCGTPWP